MYFTLSGSQCDLGRDLRAFTHRRVAFAFDRYDTEVLSVMVYLDDRQPGEEEGTFHCNVIAVTVDGQVHEVQHDALDAEPAVGQAIDRLVQRIGQWRKAWLATRDASYERLAR